MSTSSGYSGADLLYYCNERTVFVRENVVKIILFPSGIIHFLQIKRLLDVQNMYQKSGCTTIFLSKDEYLIKLSKNVLLAADINKI